MHLSCCEINDLTLQCLDQNTVPCGGCCCFLMQKFMVLTLLSALVLFLLLLCQAASWNDNSWFCNCNNYLNDEEHQWDLSHSNDWGTPNWDAEGSVDFKLCIQRAEICHECEGWQWTCQNEEHDYWYLRTNNKCTATQVGYNDRQMRCTTKDSKRLVVGLTRSGCVPPALPIWACCLRPRTIVWMYFDAGPADIGSISPKLTFLWLAKQQRGINNY